VVRQAETVAVLGVGDRARRGDFALQRCVVPRVNAGLDRALGNGTVSAHTPGPWYSFAADGRYEIGAGLPMELLAVAVGGNRETDEANARLITAAPELAQALQLLISMPVRYANNVIEIQTASHTDAMAIVRTGRAALAKAGL
jgi:hypothetical protein